MKKKMKTIFDVFGKRRINYTPPVQLFSLTALSTVQLKNSNLRAQQIKTNDFLFLNLENFKKA